MPRPRLSYANVIATIALFVALGGGAYAAMEVPANSVGSKQVRNGSINANKVKNGTLLARNFKEGQLPAGPKGETGAEGKQGPEGKEGPEGEQGEPGSPATFPTTLPVGKTLVGLYALAGIHAANNAFPLVAISFHFKLASAPTFNLIKAGAEPTVACPGDVEHPSATSGNLCIYEDINRTGVSLLNASGGVETIGAGLVILAPAEDEYEVSGAWAITG